MYENKISLNAGSYGAVMQPSISQAGTPAENFELGMNGLKKEGELRM